MRRLNYIKMVDPTYGRIVTFEITALNNHFLKAYIDQMTLLAEAFKADTEVDGNKVTITCPSEESAEMLKSNFPKQ